MTTEERREMLEQKYGKQVIRNERKRQNRWDRRMAYDLHMPLDYYREFKRGLK